MIKSYLIQKNSDPLSNNSTTNSIKLLIVDETHEDMSDRSLWAFVILILVLPLVTMYRAGGLVIESNHLDFQCIE